MFIRSSKCTSCFTELLGDSNLNWGNAEDAVKEGDGLHLLKDWKFFTYLFHLKGHNKYALAGLRLIVFYPPVSLTD